MGIKNGPGWQVVFVDTPGLTAGGGPLGEFMVKTVHRSLEEVDLVCLLVPATAAPGEMDEGPLKVLAGFRGPVFCCLTKADLVRPKTRLLLLIEAYRRQYPFKEVLPISAVDGTNCDRLLGLAVRGVLTAGGGAMRKKSGSPARRDLEAFFGIPVYLELKVEVRRNWRRDARALRELGFKSTS